MRWFCGTTEEVEAQIVGAEERTSAQRKNTKIQKQHSAMSATGICFPGL